MYYFVFHGQEKRNLSVQVGCWAEGVRPTDLTALGIPCFGLREGDGVCPFFCVTSNALVRPLLD